MKTCNSNRRQTATIAVPTETVKEMQDAGLSAADMATILADMVEWESEYTPTTA